MSSDTEITAGEIEAAAQEAAPADATPRQHTQETAEKPQPSATETAPVTEKPEDRFKGWIPPDAHKRVVDGFHSRLDEIAWAKGLERQRVERALHVLDAQERQQSERQQALPKPDAVDEKGEKFYSEQVFAQTVPQLAARMAAKIVEERMQAFEQRFQPIETTFAEHQRVAEVTQEVDAVWELPGASDYVKEMTDYITAINQRRANGEELPRVSAMDAYVAVVPKRLAERGTVSEAEIRKKILKEMNETTERVRDDVNPSRVPAASRKSDSEKSVKELLEEGARAAATA